MALSDCSECWETPCVCGNEFKNYSKERLLEFVKSAISKNPNGIEVIKELYQTLIFADSTTNINFKLNKNE